MERAKGVKVFGTVLIIFLVLNLVFFTLGKISPLWFWVVIAVMAILAWKVVPKLRK